MAKAASTTTLKVVKKGTKVKAVGEVRPKHAGKTVNVVLFRKEGGSFKKKKAALVGLNAFSRYAASFTRLKPRTCKLVARFPGDAHHKASSASKTFAC